MVRFPAVAQVRSLAPQLLHALGSAKRKRKKRKTLSRATVLLVAVADCVTSPGQVGFLQGLQSWSSCRSPWLEAPWMNSQPGP